MVRIEKLTLQNFRLFEQREFSFHPQFNLIIGENGSGKSSLLRALAIALSSVLPELGVAKENIIKIKSDDARLHIIGNESISFVSEDLVNIWLVLQEEKRSLLRKVSTNQITVNQPRFFDYNLMAKDSFIAPLCAFYTCSRFWTPQKDKTDLMIKAMQEKYHRKDGYLNWNDNLETDESFILWVQKQDIITYQEREVSLGWKILNKAMKTCFEDFDSFIFNAKLGELIIKLNKNGNIENLLFKNLSDGQRCMIGLIGDMVRRAVLLNPQLGDKVLEETSGVVLIDELDLHLHPKWQRRIINDLKTTFPKIQFICTTHSPQLIGQAKPEEIIILDQETTRHPPQSYGMDSNWILRHVMGGKDRDPVVAAKLDEVFDDIENANFEMAQSKIIELRKEIGEHPELVEAEVLIHRYTHLYEDE